MAAQGQGLIINVTAWDDDKYTVNLMYDLAKAALNRMAFGMAQDLLEKHNVAALAVAPGWMRTERVLAAFGCSADAQHIYGTTTEQEDGVVANKLKHWRDVPDLAVTESSLYLGRAVAAPAGDPEGAVEASRAGKVLRVADLAVKYGFTDVDGRQPPRFMW